MYPTVKQIEYIKEVSTCTSYRIKLTFDYLNVKTASDLINTLMSVRKSI